MKTWWQTNAENQLFYKAITTPIIRRAHYKQWSFRNNRKMQNICRRRTKEVTSANDLNASNTATSDILHTRYLLGDKWQMPPFVLRSPQAISHQSRDNSRLSLSCANSTPTVYAHSLRAANQSDKQIYGMELITYLYILRCNVLWNLFCNDTKEMVS